MERGISRAHCTYASCCLFSLLAVSAICWYQFAIYETGQVNNNATFNIDNILSTDNLRNATGVNFVSYALALVPSNPYIKQTWLAAGVYNTLGAGFYVHAPVLGMAGVIVLQ